MHRALQPQCRTDSGLLRRRIPAGIPHFRTARRRNWRSHRRIHHQYRNPYPFPFSRCSHHPFARRKEYRNLPAIFSGRRKPLPAPTRDSQCCTLPPVASRKHVAGQPSALPEGFEEIGFQTGNRHHGRQSGTEPSSISSKTCSTSSSYSRR